MNSSHNEAQESRWSRVSRELGPGLHAVGWTAGMPMHPALLGLWQASAGARRRRRTRRRER